MEILTRAAFSELQGSVHDSRHPPYLSSWLNDLLSGDVLSTNCLKEWRQWVENGLYTPLVSEPAVEI